jgi:hypothetical protein
MSSVALSCIAGKYKNRLFKFFLFGFLSHKIIVKIVCKPCFIVWRYGLELRTQLGQYTV